MDNIVSNAVSVTRLTLQQSEALLLSSESESESLRRLIEDLM